MTRILLQMPPGNLFTVIATALNLGMFMVLTALRLLTPDCLTFETTPASVEAQLAAHPASIAIPGVVSDFAPFHRTGGVTTLQEMGRNKFSKEYRP